jgi:hypothetical protein
MTGFGLSNMVRDMSLEKSLVLFPSSSKVQLLTFDLQGVSPC